MFLVRPTTVLVNAHKIIYGAVMSLQRLRTFIEVYRHRSISAAARTLAMSQPGVSQHIAGLEEAIGRPLFERTGQGVSPTSAAHDLAADLGDHLDSAEVALASARARSAELSGAIQIIGQSDFLSEYLTPMLAGILKDGMLVRLHAAGPGQLEERLLDGTADIGIAGYDVSDKRLHSQVILKQRLLAVASPQIAMQINDAVNLQSALDEMPVLTHSFRWPTIGSWLDAQGLRAPARAPDFIGHNLHSLRTLAASGYGWTVLPEYFCTACLAEGKLAIINGPQDPPENIYRLVWAPSALRNPRTASARQSILRSFLASST